MALEIFVGRTVLPLVSTGTTDFTSADSSTTPVGALHSASLATTNDTFAGDFSFNVSMSDGTLSRAISSTANNTAVLDDCSHGYYSTVVGQTTPGSNVEDGGVTHNSFIAGGQRVNNTNGFFFAGLCSHMFFAGCNFATKEVTLNATVDTAVNVDPGFAWDVVLVAQTAIDTLNLDEGDNIASFGFMTKADDSQASIAVATNNGDASPGNPKLRISTTYAGQVLNPTGGGLLYGIDVQEGSGTSCDVFPRIAGGQSILVALAFIGFTDGSSAKIVSWDTPTSTGDNAVTGTGGTPSALIHLVSRASAYDVSEADADAGTYGMSMVTADSEFCNSSHNEDNTGGTSFCRSLASNRAIRVPKHDGTVSATDSYGADHVSMDSNGWTENWTDVTTGLAGKCVTLAFIEATAASSIGGGLNRGVARGVMRGVG